MKKIILICASMIFAATVYADGNKTCKVQGTTGTVEVSVYENDTEKGTATVRFSNDTDTPANVTATISFTKGNGASAGIRSVTRRVGAQQEVVADVSCGQSYSYAKVSAVVGNRCN